jgi:hypothetical protein
MRTYVRMMGLGPYRPMRELESAIERRELDMAIGIAKDIARERRPIGLPLALDLVSLVAAEGPDYDLWACRWLARWLSETPTCPPSRRLSRRSARSCAERAAARRVKTLRSGAQAPMVSTMRKRASPLIIFS